MRVIRKKRFWFLLSALLYSGIWLISELNRPEISRPDTSILHQVDLKSEEPVVVVSEDGRLWIYHRSADGGYLKAQPVLELKESGTSVTEISTAIQELLLDEKAFHLVGQRYGAPIAIETAFLNPDQVTSLLLIDPKGLTELEWLGNALIDRSLRSIESLGLWMFDRMVPFSWNSGISLQQMFWESNLVARSNFDFTRSNIKSVSIPVGIAGSLEQSTQNREYYRVFPQSVVIDVGSEQSISRFFVDAEEKADDAPSKPDPERVQESLKDYNELYRLEVSGMALGIAMVLIALSTLISEDMACIGAGILVSQGGISVLPASIACFCGIYLGDITIYLMGRLFGEILIRKRPFRWFISLEAVESSEIWFRNQGSLVLLASRFMPGTRVPVYFAAGVLKSPFWLISLILAGAAILWVPFLIYLSCVVGDQMLGFFEQYEQRAIWGVVAVFALIFLITHKLLPLLTYRGRRLAYSRWKRLTKWEFWPAKVIYPPVFLYVMYLGIRYRSLSLGTLTNPIVPCGGLIDESKITILRSLQKAGVPVAPFVELGPNRDVTDLIESVERAQAEWEWQFPVVVKPEKGERGKGVVVVKDPDQLREVLSTLKETHIAQRYVSGEEFGVFYYRYPGCKKGAINSITRKHYTTVTGDGKSNLEHLILRDPRAVLSAKTFLKNHQEQLFIVPGEGEEVKLVEIGTHARGSMFLDARELLTPALLERMDAICSKIEGFYFGRFDLKVPSEEELKKGEKIQIIELNLLTSEPTHIYDPKHNLFYAWSALIRQWSIAYEIADLNRKKGLKPMSPVAVLAKVWKHYLNG